MIEKWDVIAVIEKWDVIAVTHEVRCYCCDNK